jgi:hypothetical protein
LVNNGRIFFPKYAATFKKQFRGLSIGELLITDEHSSLSIGKFSVIARIGILQSMEGEIHLVTFCRSSPVKYY